MQWDFGRNLIRLYMRTLSKFRKYLMSAVF